MYFLRFSTLACLFYDRGFAKWQRRVTRLSTVWEREVHESSGVWLLTAVSGRVRRSSMLADGLARFVHGRLRVVDNGIAGRLGK